MKGQVPCLFTATPSPSLIHQSCDPCQQLICSSAWKEQRILDHIHAQVDPWLSSIAGSLWKLLASVLPHALKPTNWSQLEELILSNILKLLLCLTKEANQEVFAQTLKLLGGRF